MSLDLKEAATGARSLETFRASSAAADADYVIHISLPYGYGKTDRQYSTLYVLDADTRFGTVADHAFSRGAVQEMAEVIVVGVGFPPPFDMAEMFRRHAYEYNGGTSWDLDASEFGTNLKHALAAMGVAVRVGGADATLAFLRDELMPAVAARYRVDPASRGLLGHNAAGNFVGYALFTDPTAFTAYAAISPALAYNDYEVLRLEQRYADSHQQLHARVFLAAGDMEMTGAYRAAGIVNGTTSLAERLAARNHRGLRLECALLTGANNQSTLCRALPAALPFMFPASATTEMSPALQAAFDAVADKG